jgi:predicted nucleic acid-binding Zn ribbon protein
MSPDETNKIMSNYYCKYCGQKTSSVSSLTSGTCLRHPNGANKGKHALYEGDEKSQYTCKNCGQKTSSLTQLTSGTCLRHPDGANKGKHQPAL